MNSDQTQPNMDGHLTTTKDSFRPCPPPTSAIKKVGPICFVGKQVFTLCISVDGLMMPSALRIYELLVSTQSKLNITVRCRGLFCAQFQM